jgi:hypothetical protein
MTVGLAIIYFSQWFMRSSTIRLAEGIPGKRCTRGHKIIGSTWQLSDSGHWEPRVFVSWKEGQQAKQTPLVFTRTFSSESAVEKEGFRMAKKWINDGKPELRVGPT